MDLRRRAPGRPALTVENIASRSTSRCSPPDRGQRPRHGPRHPRGLDHVLAESVNRHADPLGQRPGPRRRPLRHDPTRFGQGLGECGHEVTLLGPGVTSLPSTGWTIRPLRSGLGPGDGRAIAEAILDRWGEISTLMWCWSKRPLLRTLLKAGVLDDVPWMLLDRSPPPTPASCTHPLVRGVAHGGLPPRPAASMQDRWAPWSAKPMPVGCAPSRNSTPNASWCSGRRRFAPLPARSERRSTERTLHMVYHGRMDRNRGVLALPMVLRPKRRTGRDPDPDGRGRCPRRPQAHGEGQRRRPRAWPAPSGRGGASPRHLTLGLLPMPEHRAWSLASPLKRSEYLALG